MIEVNSKSIKTWSTIGPRPTFGLALTEIAKAWDDLMVVTADVSTSAGLDRFRRTFPEKFIDVGIAEQNMIGVAAGLADCGYNVFTTTFAPFQTLRCLDQIKVNLAYSNIKVTMVGLASGLINGPLGNTHCCIEDIGVLRSIPNIQILAPADGLGIIKAVLMALTTDTPTYIRLTGGANYPIVYSEDRDFVLGKAIEVLSGSDVAIFASGSSVSNSIKAAEILARSGVNASVWDMHTIKPIDQEALKRECDARKLIVTVEEHNVIGGLGSAVAEWLARFGHRAHLLPIGVGNVFLDPGDYEFMQRQSGLDADSIAKAILGELNNSGSSGHLNV